MFYSNLKILIKQLLRNKTYTAITILGFSISLMFVILLSVYIESELSVDKFQKNKDRIYRFTTGESSSSAPPVGSWLAERYPEIETFTRFYKIEAVISDLKEQKLQSNIFLVDSSFFTMFSFPLMEGDSRNVFKAKNSIVLSKSFARKLFGNVSPVGKEIDIDLRFKLIVTGVIEDIPENTHFESCDAFIPFNSIAELWGNIEILTSFNNSSFTLYILTKPNTNIISKESEILSLFKKCYPMYTGGFAKSVKFEPLTNIYFGGIHGHATRGNSKKFIVVFSTIAILILILAIINYINLTIAQSSLRSREVAIKKLHGSSKSRLIFQFIAESIIICIVAFNVALLLSKLAEPVFNSLLNTHLNLSHEFNIVKVLIYLGGIILIGVISGLIPAIVITKYKAIDIIKGSFRRKSKSVFGKALISFQYIIAIILIICTWIVAKQTYYMKNFDIGFKKDNIIYFGNDIEKNQRAAFKDELKKIPGVVDVAYAAGSPLDGGNNWSMTYPDKSVSFQVFNVDTAFIKMFGFIIKPTGVAFSKDAFYLNESAIKELEMDSLPKTFKFPKSEIPVYGVVKDFYFRDLHQKIGSAIMFNLKEDDDAWSIFVSISGRDQQNTIEKIKGVHDDFTKGLPFTFDFADETIHKWYKKDEQTAKMIGYLTVLAIMISVMGILAMATFYIQQRIKEIGIRKVNGATEMGILGLLNIDLIKWVLLAFVVACPIAYYISDKWLQDFPYRTTISWWVFILSGIIALFFALITVSWQSWRAASRNPVEALRYE